MYRAKPSTWVGVSGSSGLKQAIRVEAHGRAASTARGSDVDIVFAVSTRGRIADTIFWHRWCYCTLQMALGRRDGEAEERRKGGARIYAPYQIAQ